MEKISSSIIKGLCSSNIEKMNNSFNIIFKKYKKLIYYVALDMIKDSYEAEEVVNETFMKMYENRRKLKNENSLKYFLLVTGKNLSINVINKRKEVVPYDDDIQAKEDSNNFTYLNDYLEKFKDVLDESEYQYLVFHLIYEFSFREIAKVNGLTVSQVSSKYRRAIIKLRKFYNEEKL